MNVYQVWFAQCDYCDDILSYADENIQNYPDYQFKAALVERYGWIQEEETDLMACPGCQENEN